MCARYRTTPTCFKIMIKPIISAALLLVHIVIMIYYCGLSPQFKIEHKAICTILFYGSALILPNLNNIITKKDDMPFQILIFHSHSLFCLVVGTIYVLHYSGLLISNYLNITIYCSCFFTIFTIIFYNLIRYGLLKKNGRN